MNPAFDDWLALETLMRTSYAPMSGRIDPPSFLESLTQADIISKAKSEDFFLAREGGRPIACGFGVLADKAYEIGKIAVSPHRQRQGFCGALLNAASARALELKATHLQLYVRVELTENHVVYDRLGFTHFADFTHSGYDRTTAYILRRPL